MAPSVIHNLTSATSQTSFPTILPIATFMPARQVTLLLLGHAKHWFKSSHLVDSIGLWLKNWTLDSDCQVSNMVSISLPVRSDSIILCLSFLIYKIRILLCILFLWSPKELIHVATAQSLTYLKSSILHIQWTSLSTWLSSYSVTNVSSLYLSKSWPLFLAQSKY